MPLRPPARPARAALAALVASALALPAVATADPPVVRPAASRLQAGALPERPRPSRPGKGTGEEAPDATVRLVVKPARGTGRAELGSAGRRMGFGLGRSIPRIGWTIVTVKARDAEGVARRLKAEGLATAVEPDRKTRPALLPDDALFGQQWALHNTGQLEPDSEEPGTPDADIDAPEAWEVSTGSSEVVVAVCDTGAQLTHPDLAGNAWTNPDEIAANGVDDDGNGMIDDVNGWDWIHWDGSLYDPGDLDPETGEPFDSHGTHVSGTIGAAGGNGIGVAGVNHDVSIMSLKTLGVFEGDLADAAEAIVYAVDHGATVINHSWISDSTIQAFDDALAYAAQHGVLNVAAAGNDGTSNSEVPWYPASSDATNVIAVGASDRNDGYPYFSNWGPDIDLAAPGVQVTSTIPGGYGPMSGTSMATPHVTGAAALIAAALPGISASEIRARIEETVDRPHGVSPWTRTGGRLDVAASLDDFAAAPEVTDPMAGQNLLLGSEYRATWTPSPFTAPGTQYEVQAGVEEQPFFNGFESDLALAGWTPGGDEPFERSATYAHAGSYGARSAVLGHDQTSWIERTVTVPEGGGELRFWYLLDSEDWYDWAYMTVNGMLVWYGIQDVPWTRAVLPMPEGTYTVRWGYAKDESVTEGLDALVLDDVSVVADTWETPVLAPAGSTQATFTAPVAASTAAKLRVRGLLGGRTSNWTVVEGLRTVADADPPGAPTGLAAQTGNRRVVLGWDGAPEPDLKEWEVWRATGTGPFAKRATVTSPAFTDTSVSNDVTYRYRVYARDHSLNLGPSSPVVSATPDLVFRRLAGSDRYATAIAVSKAGFASADRVVLATGEAFPDALSASALAGAYGAPLLLTPTDRLPSGLVAEIERLGAEEVVIVGGTPAVSKAVANALAASYAVTRVYGSDRYATAAAVASRVRALGGGGRVFVARGDAFPDALSASPLAYSMRYPVLLVKPDGVPGPTASAIASLRPSQAIVLGSRSAISDGVRGALGVSSERWGGADRYATSAIVAVNGSNKGWASFGAIGVATGAAFPDALGGGAALGELGGVLLLTAPDRLSSAAEGVVEPRRAQVDEAYVIGGSSAVSADAMDALGVALDL